jgi:hypothetical protein
MAEMADYYPVLARAVSSLSDNNAQARRELYERARTIVIEQLRRRDPRELMPETAQERDALEAAIHKVEMESRAALTPATGRQAQSLPPERRATSAAKPLPRPAAAAAQPKPTASYLAKILQALQPGDAADEKAAKSGHAKARKRDATALRPNKIDRPDDPPIAEPGEMGGMLVSLGTMMLALTYCVAALAFTGVVYFRGSVMVSAGIIGYPILLLMTTAVVCLFVIPPWAYFRRSSASPTIGFLLRAIHSASREAS